MNRQPHIFYLHGFNSSPQSYKAQAMSRGMHSRGLEDALTIADIPANPALAETYLVQQAASLCDRYEVTFVGSSLGGFYATWLAERYRCRAVLINPAVRPHERLHEYLGENRNYHTGDSWEFTRDDLRTLQSMSLPSLAKPSNYLVLLQTGDETLDYRQAEAFYAGSNMLIEQGGDHAFQGFEDHIDDILRFAGFTL